MKKDHKFTWKLAQVIIMSRKPSKLFHECYQIWIGCSLNFLNNSEIDLKLPTLNNGNEGN